MTSSVPPSPAPPSPDARPLRFEGWEIRPDERLLLVRGRTVTVGGRAFDLLLVLARSHPRTVTKSELMDRVWEGLVVEENNISVQVAALRKLVGNDAIRTVAGRGYQLVARPLGDEPGTAPAGRAPQASAAPAAGAALPTAGAGPDAPIVPSPPRAAPPDELVGRERESQDFADALRGARLLSVVGPGGVGKTTLVRERLGARDAGASPCWIDLAPMSEPRQLVPLLAKALEVELADGPDAAAELLAALGQLQRTLVLDNCEHLHDAVSGWLSLALPAAPGVRWVVTSQAPLRVSGEVLFRLEPLRVPPPGVNAAQAMEFGAVALLCLRAAAADRRFRLDDDNVQAVVTLCRELDGLPLALELAAPRVAAFGLEEVTRRLGERLRLLGRRDGLAYRHDTLRATYAWSHALLAPVEQRVFRRLQPFVGGFRVDIAQEVAADVDGLGGLDTWQALDALFSLVDKSLLQRDAASGRLSLLESARDFAAEQLEAHGEAGEARTRHAQAVARTFAHARHDAERMSDADWAAHYEPERHNVRAALRHAAALGEPDLLARLVAAMGLLDSSFSRRAELLAFALPLEVLAAAAPVPRAFAWLELGWAHYNDGDRALAAELLRGAFEALEAAGDAAFAYRALAQLTRVLEAQPGRMAEAQAAWDQLRQRDDRTVPLRTRLFCRIAAGLLHRPDFTFEHMRELERLAQGAGFQALAGVCRANLTDKMLIAGRYAEVVALAQEGLSSAFELPRARAAIQHNQVLALVHRGRSSEAYAPARAAFLAMPSAAHFLIDTFALAAAREGRLLEAAVLAGCGARVRRERHEKSDLAEAAAIAETESLLRAGLPAGEREELERMGAAMTPEEALAIQVFARAAPSTAAGGGPDLSRARDAAAAGPAGPAS